MGSDLPVVKAVRALALMHEALVLLDEAGAHVARDKLRVAIETLAPPARY